MMYMCNQFHYKIILFWTFHEDDVIMKIYHKVSHQAGKKKLNKNLTIEISQSFGFLHIVQSRIFFK